MDRDRVVNFEGLALGLPVWAHAGWRGPLYPAAARAAEFLAHYARCFNAVEGNASFYAEPDLAQLGRWRAQVPAGFQFCWKFPRRLSHEAALLDVDAGLRAFVARMQVLKDRLGPFLLQLGPRFGPPELPRLAHALKILPRGDGLAYAVEVRHPRFHDGGVHEAALDALLAEQGVDRAHMDTRILRATSLSDPTTLEARQRKPDLPLRHTVTARRPLLRLIGSNVVAEATAVLDEWAPRIAGWLAAGLKPLVFCHTPDDLHAPALAAALYQRLRVLRPTLPPLPIPVDAVVAPQQMSLF